MYLHASQLLRCLLRDWCGQVVGKSIPRLAESDSKVHSKSINKCKVQTIFLWHNGAHKSFYVYTMILCTLHCIDFLQYTQILHSLSRVEHIRNSTSSKIIIHSSMELLSDEKHKQHTVQWPEIEDYASVYRSTGASYIYSLTCPVPYKCVQHLMLSCYVSYIDREECYNYKSNRGWPRETTDTAWRCHGQHCKATDTFMFMT